MKITNVIPYPLVCPINEPFAYSQKWFNRRTALLIKVETDEGISGWGESFCHDAGLAIAVIIDRIYKPLASWAGCTGARSYLVTAVQLDTGLWSERAHNGKLSAG